MRTVLGMVSEALPRSATSRRAVLLGCNGWERAEPQSHKGRSAPMCSPPRHSNTADSLRYHLRRMEKRALLWHNGNSLEGPGRFDAQEYNAICSYSVAAPHGPAFF